MDAYQVRTWQGWHHHMALSVIAVWFLIDETHRGQQFTPALTLPQGRYGLSVLLMEAFLTRGVSTICRQVQRQLLRNESARFYHHRARKCLPPRKLRRDYSRSRDSLTHCHTSTRSVPSSLASSSHVLTLATHQIIVLRSLADDLVDVFSQEIPSLH